eukprot:7152858-Pyramimonas_sp.AAC.1
MDGNEKAAVAAPDKIPIGLFASAALHDKTISNTTIHPPRAFLETYQSRSQRFRLQSCRDTLKAPLCFVMYVPRHRGKCVYEFRHAVSRGVLMRIALEGAQFEVSGPGVGDCQQVQALLLP